MTKNKRKLSTPKTKIPKKHKKTSTFLEVPKESTKQDIDVFVVDRTKYADVDWIKWISATCTRNYLLKDPILDWLSYYSNALAVKNSNYISSINQSLHQKTTTTPLEAPFGSNITEFIMSQGHQFESKLIEHLYKIFDKSNIIDIGGEIDPRSPDKFQETIDAMNRGIPIIHSGVLHDFDTQTYGIPDLLIRSDWIRKLVKISPIDMVDEVIPALKLQNIYDSTKNPKYHYRIIDIKFSTLHLRSDGIHLVNAGSIPAYKGQLWIYNEILGKIQGYNPQISYILGRKWKMIIKGETRRGNSCLDRLGTINYNTIDFVYKDKTLKALEWIRRMRQDGSTWNLTDDKLQPELYPNMSNTHDYPWHSVKVQLADKIDEITSLWMCGVKQREHAHSFGVYKWSDPNCDMDTLGINGDKTRRILSRILDMNRNKDANIVIKPDIIMNNWLDWQHPKRLEFFVDFETVNDILTDFSMIPNVKSTSLIFMIGVGHYEPDSKEWVYQNFTVSDLTLDEELLMLKKFSQYIETKINELVLSESGNIQPLLFHWSPAEPSQWLSALERHTGLLPFIKRYNEHVVDENENKNENRARPIWFDILSLFKSEPIIIKDAFGFGLKEICKAMNRHKLIQTCWNTNSDCTDGASAMLGAYLAYKETKSKTIQVTDIPIMKEIIKYNEMDCKVMGDIIYYLREHHVVQNPT